MFWLCVCALRADVTVFGVESVCLIVCVKNLEEDESVLGDFSYRPICCESFRLTIL